MSDSASIAQTQPNLNQTISPDITSIQYKINLYLKNYFNNLLNSNNSNCFGQTRLINAMKYSTLNGGKRFRAILTYLSGYSILLEDSLLTPIAGAIELVHAFSLIHDDLPAMDNDTLRRGLPTCHIKFDEATAILAGDALLSEAFNMLGKAKPASADNLLKSYQFLAESIGPRGVVAGQSIDVNNHDIKNLNNLDNLNNLHNLKTGKLIQASVLIPFILRGFNSSDKIFQLMQDYANHLGISFQIQDDILDITGSTNTLGKTAKKDIIQNKLTYPYILKSISLCQEHLQNQCDMAYEAIDKAIEYCANHKISHSCENFAALKFLVKWNQTRTS